MPLRTVAIPNPPAGREWVALVPGKYLYDVTAITATLATPGGFTTMHDASGNAHNGFYASTGGFPTSVAGIVAGDAAAQFGALTGTHPCASATIPPTVIDWTGPFTIEFYATLGTGFNAGYVVAVGPIVTGSYQLSLYLDTSGNLRLERQDGFTADDWLYDLSALVLDGLGHRYCITYDATDAVLYLDTNVIAPLSSVVNGPTLTAATSARVNEHQASNTGVPFVLDELAIYDHALTAGDDAAHAAAAAASFTAYTSAVLANTPGGYYHLDDGASTGRQPVLTVVTSTGIVEMIPTGFPISSAPGPYRYSWNPNLPASTQSPDGTVTTVAIPRLLLPAGYSVGTFTPDLETTDQWSDITLWWSDDAMNALDPINIYAYPPGVKLVYRQEETQP